MQNDLLGEFARWASLVLEFMWVVAGLVWFVTFVTGKPFDYRKAGIALLVATTFVIGLGVLLAYYAPR
jgi:hypothetical protein